MSPFGPPQPIVPNNQPYYIRTPQNWAVEQERQRHQQALYMVGEPALFLLMWRVEDFNAGLTTQCPRCRATDGGLNARIETVYQQPLSAVCPYCFGTTFYGGVRAKIIRPAIFTDIDEDERRQARGVVHPESCMVETTHDFRSRTGDYVCRADGSRWMLSTPSRVQLRTGFTHPVQGEQSIGYARIPAAREDESSVAFQIPPVASELGNWLVAPVNWPGPPVDDVLNGPLIPSTEVG